MAKTIKESQKNRDPYKERGRYGEETDPISRRGSFRAGDAVLILLAVLLVAVLIVLASVIVPAVRENYREYKEELLITVDIPVTHERVERLPVPGDAWVLLDYKTDRFDDEEAFRTRYAMQLEWYARALERITGTPVGEMWLYAIGIGRAFLINRQE